MIQTNDGASGRSVIKWVLLSLAVIGETTQRLASPSCCLWRVTSQ